MHRLTIYALTTAVLLLGPATARAQGRVTPFFSGSFGGSAGEGLGIGDDQTGWYGFGINGGWTMGWLGIEADVAHFPQFFAERTDFLPKAGLLTAMGNVRVGVPIGMGLAGMAEGAMPYVSAGLGVIRPNIREVGGLATFKEARFGWNAGGGIGGYFSEHVGLEGDIRYFRRADDDEAEPNAFGIDFDGFDFWRGSLGLSFRW